MRRYIKSDEISRFTVLLLNISSFYTINEKIEVCRDVKDNKFLELAVAGNATFLISSDEDLKVLHPFRNISIISPSDFLRLNIER